MKLLNIERSGQDFSTPIGIPNNVRDWPLDQMPLSIRLAGVLQKMGFRKLGDLHGVLYTQVLCMRNCGQRSIKELKALVERVQDGEFDYGRIKGLGLDFLVKQMDESISKINDREKEMLLFRLGGGDQRTFTLEEIGMKYDLTRERVRQVVDLLYQKLYKEGGPAVGAMLQRIAQKCLEIVCPLTPDLLSLWLGSKIETQYPAAFYVRLFGELERSIPAWPEGQKPYPNLDARAKDIIRPVSDILRQNISPLPLSQVYRHLSQAGQPAKLTAGEFLRALKQCGTLSVEFEKPSEPVVRIASLRICDWVQRVLAQSDHPLRPEEIISQAKKLFGNEVPLISIGGLRNSLRPEQGIFLLDRRAFGMKQHIQLPEKIWPKLRADIYQLLKDENRPVSTREMLKRNRFPWAKQTNVHELAHLLREDGRFVDLGRFLYALKEWGLAEREHIKDLIPEALKEAGHPMTATEILKELRRKRSVGRATISAVIRHHEGVRHLGFGYYGLKTWKEMDKSFYVSQPLLIRRIILRAKHPFTFGDLCAELKIPVKGKYAEQLWETIIGLRRVKTKPEIMSPETQLIHKTWRNE